VCVCVLLMEIGRTLSFLGLFHISLVHEYFSMPYNCIYVLQTPPLNCDIMQMNLNGSHLISRVRVCTTQAYTVACKEK